jgi:hypothetical protein
MKSFMMNPFIVDFEVSAEVFFCLFSCYYHPQITLISQIKRDNLRNLCKKEPLENDTRVLGRLQVDCKHNVGCNFRFVGR